MKRKRESRKPKMVSYMQWKLIRMSLNIEIKNSLLNKEPSKWIFYSLRKLFRRLKLKEKSRNSWRPKPNKISKLHRQRELLKKLILPELRESTNFQEDKPSKNWRCSNMKNKWRLKLLLSNKAVNKSWQRSQIQKKQKNLKRKKSPRQKKRLLKHKKLKLKLKKKLK